VQALILLASAVLISHALSLALDVLFRALVVLFRAAPSLSLALDVLFRVPPLPSDAQALLVVLLFHALGALNAFHVFHALFLIVLATFPLSLSADSAAETLLQLCVPVLHDSLTPLFYLASSCICLHFDPTYCLKRFC
jgi:hypothetical protein